MKTAEDFFNQYKDCVMLPEGGYEYLVDEPDFLVALTEFAKLHVEAALKAASEEAEAYYYDEQGDQGEAFINKTSILDAYSLKNIK